MKKLFACLLLLFTTNSLARLDDPILELLVTPVQVSQKFDAQTRDIGSAPDLVDKKEKVDNCVDEYIKRNLRSFSKRAQHNLYDLIHDFDRILSRVHGKKLLEDDIPHNDKIEALAIVQCDAYYAMGILK